MQRHLPFGITQCHLPPDIAEHARAGLVLVFGQYQYSIFLQHF